ncbi:NUDIX hydrolase [Roseovarius sp. EL26]|uniref:NUDIX hydrolase n=1 Tax=Roseovarius sp. EL26 TaxID=2126672 RepID=UPI000EA09CBB|nr:NUDIX hydrolase [Roseovarius sp. EL26]
MARKIQYGVVPYLKEGNKTRIIMVTSRTHRQWIFPKGGRVSGLSRRKSALQEALEEAGLKGRIDKKAEFTSTIIRNGEKIDLVLYPMQVDKMKNKWDEMHQRRRVVISPRKAEKIVTCKGMRKGIKKWLRWHDKIKSEAANKKAA